MGIKISFGINLQILRKLHNGMTQEELAEKLGVSRQTVSKWELDAAFPEMEKAVELCRFFSCSMDQLIREDMSVCNDAYTDIRLEKVEAFRYVRYAVVSMEPEEDAVRHVRGWAAGCGMEEPRIIGWDFPFVSQEQINVFHMHGYAAAWILPPDIELSDPDAQVVFQKEQQYAALTVREPFQSPFSLIPNAYKTLSSFMQVNGLKHRNDEEVLSCFEKVYGKDGRQYMDIYIAAL